MFDPTCQVCRRQFSGPLLEIDDLDSSVGVVVLRVLSPLLPGPAPLAVGDSGGWRPGATPRSAGWSRPYLWLDMSNVILAITHLQ